MFLESIKNIKSNSDFDLILYITGLNPFCFMRTNIYIETLHYRLQIEPKNGIMEELYSPDKMVEISIFSFELQLAKTDGSKVVARHFTVAAIRRSSYAPY